MCHAQHTDCVGSGAFVCEELRGTGEYTEGSELMLLVLLVTSLGGVMLDTPLLLLSSLMSPSHSLLELNVLRCENKCMLNVSAAKGESIVSLSQMLVIMSCSRPADEEDTAVAPLAKPCCDREPSVHWHQHDWIQ